jgi:hypothetical protein
MVTCVRDAVDDGTGVAVPGGVANLDRDKRHVGRDSDDPDPVGLCRNCPGHVSAVELVVRARVRSTHARARRNECDRVAPARTVDVRAGRIDHELVVTPVDAAVEYPDVNGSCTCLHVMRPGCVDLLHVPLQRLQRVVRLLGSTSGDTRRERPPREVDPHRCHEGRRVQDAGEPCTGACTPTSPICRERSRVTVPPAAFTAASAAARVCVNWKPAAPCVPAKRTT